MSTIKNADEQPNDKFGYSCYAIVIPAPNEIIETCNYIERESGMIRAKIPAHITVKGTFCRIDDLNEVKQTILVITDSTPPFQISFEGAKSIWWLAGGGLSVPVSPEMQKLHDALVAEIAPVSTSAYQDDPYRSHLTYVQDASPEGLERTKELIAQTNLGDGFIVEAVNLMGRVGKAYGGEWRLIQHFVLRSTS